MFPQIYCSPENGLAFVPCIFVCIFSVTGFAERSYLSEILLSFDPSFFLSQNNSLQFLCRESFFMFWGYLGYLSPVQNEETCGRFKQKELVRKKRPPVSDPSSSTWWIRAEEASRVYLNPQLRNPFFSERFLQPKQNALQKMWGI